MLSLVTDLQKYTPMSLDCLLAFVHVQAREAGLFLFPRPAELIALF